MKIETPFDHPSTLVDRITFPSLRRAYLDGWQSGSQATVDNLSNLGWKFPTPTSIDK